MENHCLCIVYGWKVGQSIVLPDSRFGFGWVHWPLTGTSLTLKLKSPKFTIMKFHIIRRDYSSVLYIWIYHLWSNQIDVRLYILHTITKICLILDNPFAGAPLFQEPFLRLGMPSSFNFSLGFSQNCSVLKHFYWYLVISTKSPGVNLLLKLTRIYTIYYYLSYNLLNNKSYFLQKCI
jgi:hypothetical protein